MAVVHVFNGIGKEYKTYNITGKLQDAIPELKNNTTVCLKGGHSIKPDYIVENDDIIFVRRTPADPVTAVVLIVSVIALGVGVGFGVHAYMQNQALQEKMEKAQRNQKKLQEKVEVLPFLRGARNRPAGGQTMPFVMGEHLFTPYRLCPAHFTFSGLNGEDEFYNVVLECGFNPLVIRNISLGKTIIKKFESDTPQDGVYKFDKGSYYDERNIIEIRQTGDFENKFFNKKIVPDFVNEKLNHEYQKAGEPVIRQAAENTLSVEVVILFDGLRWFNGANWSEQSATVVPYWSNNPNDTNPDWHEFTFEQNGVLSNVFRYNSKKQMRFAARKTFTAAESFGKKISVKIERTTQKAEKNSQEECFFYMLQTSCYDAQKSSSTELVPCKIIEDRERDMCTRLALRIAATPNTKDMLEEINIIAAACARTWDGTNWTEDKKPTRNSAAWILEVLTCAHHNASRYEDTELDMKSFGALYEYCEAEKFYTDGVITKSEPKKRTIQTILENVNSTLVLNADGLIEAVTDKKETNAVALLNSDNIMSISTTKDFSRKSDGKKCTFVNRNGDWQIDNVIIMRPNKKRTPQSILTETALQYITDYEHAFKYVRRQLAQEILQPKTVTVKVGKEGAYYPLYSCVLLQHRSLKIGLSFGTIEALEITDDKITAIHSDGYFDFVAGHRYGIVINCIGENTRGIVPVKVTGKERTNTLTLIDPIPLSSAVLPEAGNSFSFGLLSEEGDFSRITSKMKIIDISPEKDGYMLTLVDYNEALYEYGDIPVYRSNLTSPPKAIGSVEQEKLTQADILDRLSEVKPNGVIIQYSVDGTSAWHAVYNSNDVFMRQSTDGGKNWSAPIRIKGEAGKPIVTPDATKSLVYFSCADISGEYLVNNAKKNSFAKLTGGKQVPGISGQALQFSSGQGMRFNALAGMTSCSVSVFFKLDTHGVIMQQCDKSLKIKTAIDKLIIYPDPTSVLTITEPVALNKWHCIIYSYDNVAKKEYVRLYTYTDDNAIRYTIDTAHKWEYDNITRDFTSAHDETIEQDTELASGTIDEIRIDGYCWNDEECAGWAYLKGGTGRLFTAADYQLENVKKIVNDAAPRYLGKFLQDPNEIARINDWYAYSGETTAERIKGRCYRRVSSTLWAVVDSWQENIAAMPDLLSIADKAINDSLPAGQFTSVLAACDVFAKRLVANEAFVNKLATNEAFIIRLATNEAFIDNLVTKRLLVDSDTHNPNNFEIAINEQVGILAKKEGKNVFEINKTGNIFAKNATLVDGIFTGEIHSGPLDLAPIANNLKVIEIKPNESVASICNRYGHIDYLCENIMSYPKIFRVTTRITLNYKYIIEPILSLFPMRIGKLELVSDLYFLDLQTEQGVETYSYIYIHSVRDLIGNGTGGIKVGVREDKRCQWHLKLTAKQGSKLLKLNDLPTVPGEKGSVFIYNLKNGTLDLDLLCVSR